jgi:hypothetical protein
MPQNKPGIFLLSVPSSAPLTFQRLLLDRCSMKCQEELASEYFTQNPRDTIKYLYLTIEHGFHLPSQC